MCDPLTIGGIILTGASVAANSYAQSQIMDARNSAMEAERIRQQGLDREADALNLQSRDRYKGFEEKQDDRGQKLGEMFQENQTPTTPSPQLMPASSSNIVVAENAKQASAAKDYSNQQAKALGNLRAFGDLLGEDSRLQARDATQIGQIGDFKRGSSNVLQLELQAANGAGGGAGLLGDILGGIGGLALKGGISGASPFGASSSIASSPISAPSMALSAGKPASTIFGSGALRGTGGLY